MAAITEQRGSRMTNGTSCALAAAWPSTALIRSQLDGPASVSLCACMLSCMVRPLCPHMCTGACSSQVMLLCLSGVWLMYLCVAFHSLSLW